MKIKNSLFVSFILLFNSLTVFSAEKKPKKEKRPTLNIRELALPSEIQNISKTAGSIYYSPSIKDKVLMPVHFWGQVAKTGLHFMPLDTTLVQGLSMAGGPSSGAILDSIRVTRRVDKKLANKHFDLEEGGDSTAHDYKLQPGDTIFVKKSDFLANRAYYTSLIGVLATTLSTLLIFREVKRDRR